MKSLLALFAALFPPLLALAQAPAPGPVPSPAAIYTPAPAVASPSSPGNAHEAAASVPLPGQPAGPALEKTLPLIPQTAPSGSPGSHSAHGHRGQAHSTPHKDTFTVEHDIRLRISMRKAETRVMNDPAMQAEWEAAHRARSDPQRRALLTLFYTHLYDRVGKLDPSVAEHAEARKQAAITRMAYTRLGDPDNSEDPFVAPTPEGSGPNPPNPEETNGGSSTSGNHQ